MAPHLAVLNSNSNGAPGRRNRRAATGDPVEGFIGDLIQVFGPPTRARPALRLMVAILEQAVEDLKAHRGASNLSRRQLYLDAYTWASSSDRSHAFAFLNVCETLGYSATAVRRRVL